MAQIRSKPFGVTKEGANVTEYILSNPGGMSVSVLDYGCVIKNIIVPAKNGPVDVVLGHDTMADYENDFTSSGSTLTDIPPGFERMYSVTLAPSLVTPKGLERICAIGPRLLKLFSEMQKGQTAPFCILSVFMIISQFYGFVLDSF